MIRLNFYQKEKTILRKAGLTKHQLDTFMSLYNGERYSSYRLSGALTEMRKFFGDSFIHLDNATFDKYFNAFVEMINGWRNEMYPQLDSMDIDRNKFIRNVVRIGEKHNTVYRVLNDTLNQYRGLNAGTHPEINWYFDSYSDVVRAHDAIDELKRAVECSLPYHEPCRSIFLP